MDEKIIYYQKQVGYDVGVKRHVQDNQGVMLTRAQPWVGIKSDTLRDFLIANKRVLKEGLIIQVEEPSVEIITPNGVTDEEIDKTLSNFQKTKRAMEEIDSLPVLYRFLDRAKEKNVSKNTVKLIEDTIADRDETVAIDLDAVHRRIFDE